MKYKAMEIIWEKNWTPMWPHEGYHQGEEPL